MIPLFMKTQVTATIKITVKGTELELTPDEARELVSELTKVLPSKPTDWGDYHKAVREAAERMRPQEFKNLPYIPPPTCAKDFFQPVPGTTAVPPGVMWCGMGLTAKGTLDDTQFQNTCLGADTVSICGR